MSEVSVVIQCLSQLRTESGEKLRISRVASNLRGLARKTNFGKAFTSFPLDDTTVGMREVDTTMCVLVTYPVRDATVTATLFEEYDRAWCTVTKAAGRISVIRRSTDGRKSDNPSMEFILDPLLGRLFHIHQLDDLLRDGALIMPIANLLEPTESTSAGTHSQGVASWPHRLALRALLLRWVLAQPDDPRCEQWRQKYPKMRTDPLAGILARQLSDTLLQCANYLRAPELREPVPLVRELPNRAPPAPSYIFAMNALQRAVLRMDDLK